MLGTGLWICSAIAVALGVAHAIYAYRQETGEFASALSRHPVRIRLRAGYRALWTLGLWLLLGTTLVIYWLLALLPYLIAAAIRDSRHDRAEKGRGLEPSS